jgi:transaldolase
VYDNYGFTTEILAASLRHPQHVVESMLLGADCCTLPPKVLWQLTKHPLTDRGLDAFMADWKKLGASI